MVRIQLREPRSISSSLSNADARRVALAALGFAAPRPAAPSTMQLRRTVDRLSLFQLDSVNVLARAHYLPGFSRIGAYDRGALDALAWGAKRERRMFEYWAHEASLLPLDLHPLLRWRMARADRGEAGWSSLRAFATGRRAEAMAVLVRLRNEGALPASAFDRGRTGWWEWSDAKRALEWLFWAGHVTTAARRATFERVYDLTERVIPPRILALPTPSEPEAHRGLVERAARAHGVATEGDLRDYFRLSPADVRAAIGSLAEEGVIVPVTVEGWRRPAWLHRDARVPARIKARALLAPFDPLVWERARTERLFGFRYRLEIYTPAARRIHGYYVLPFLLGDRLMARVDLKANRHRRCLEVQAIHLEPDAPAEMEEELRTELATLADWLALDTVAPPSESPAVAVG